MHDNAAAAVRRRGSVRWRHELARRRRRRARSRPTGVIIARSEAARSASSSTATPARCMPCATAARITARRSARARSAPGSRATPGRYELGRPTGAALSRGTAGSSSSTAAAAPTTPGCASPSTTPASSRAECWSQRERELETRAGPRDDGWGWFSDGAGVGVDDAGQRDDPGRSDGRAACAARCHPRPACVGDGSPVGDDREPSAPGRTAGARAGDSATRTAGGGYFCSARSCSAAPRRSPGSPRTSRS